MPPTFDENTVLLWHILETQKTKPEFDFAAVGAKMGLSIKAANMRFYRFKKAMERELGHNAKMGVGEASGTAGSTGDEAKKKGGKGAKGSKKRKHDAVEDDAEDRVSVISDQTVTGGDEEI